MKPILRLLLSAAAAGALLGASTVPGAADSAALLALLAPAPSADWVEAGPAAGVLEGPFTAHSYAAYIKVISPSTAGVESDLDHHQFAAGYGRMWVQRASNDVLAERVFQFAANAGAEYWYSKLRFQNKLTRYFVRDIPGVDAIPQSFGVVLKAPDGTYLYRVEFRRGDKVFVIHMNSAANDLGQAAVAQALAEANPPAGPTVRSGAAAATYALAAVPAVLVILALVAGAGLIAMCAAVLILTRRTTVRALTGFVISTDGAFWWDGSQWRASASDPPPPADQRSGVER